MGFSQKQSTEHKRKRKRKPIIAIQQVQEQIAWSELKDDEVVDVEIESEPLEPQELEDYSDSEAMLQGESADTPFDSEWVSTTYSVSQLPLIARPQVRYLIDEHCEVHRLDRNNDSVSRVRHLIARAVATHIRNSKVSLVNPGDWCGIPSLYENKNLFALIPDNEGREDAYNAVRSEADVKHFAILLSNGDVVTPNAIIEYARQDKLATNAAALREAANNESIKSRSGLAGEAWTKEEWKDFEKNQRRSRNRSKKAKAPSSATNDHTNL